jgi:predicted histone-like DNA-binding protein
MIDYSIYLQPNPMDETAAPKAYAKAQMRENMTFSDFVSHIAGHNGVFSRGTVKGVLSDAVYCLVEQLLEGKKVQLGELGNFWVTLTSVGADSMENFSTSNIKEVNIIFTPGEDFENLRSRATFNLVASRVAQAATLKTEKLGGTVVDLEAARAAARLNSSGSTSQGSASSNTNGTNTSPSNPRLTINRTGNGNSTVTANGSAVTSGSELEAGTVVSLSVTPAEGATPTATLNGSSVALTENEGVYSGSFQMPSANATLAINSGSATGGDSGNMD